MSVTEIRSLNGHKLIDETARDDIEKLRTESQQYTDTVVSELDMLSIDVTDVEQGTAAGINADTLGGKAASDYVLEDDFDAYKSKILNEYATKSEIASEYLRKNETAADSTKLGGKAPEYYIQPRNLLDNSDFRNPVNQRNIPYGGSGDTGYKIDRWKYENGGQGADTSAYFGLVKNMYISLYPPSDGYVQLSQNLERYEAMKGKTYTFAMRATYRGVPQTIAASFAMGGVPNGLQLVADSTVRLFSVDGNNLLIRLHGDMGTQDELAIAWAALYEGSFTVENLPPYVPKGYGAELMECARYFQRIEAPAWAPLVVGHSLVAGYLECIIPVLPMRTKQPTLVFASSGLYVNGESNMPLNATIEKIRQTNGNLSCQFKDSQFAKGSGSIGTRGAISYMDICADL